MPSPYISPAPAAGGFAEEDLGGIPRRDEAPREEALRLEAPLDDPIPPDERDAPALEPAPDRDEARERDAPEAAAFFFGADLREPDFADFEDLRDDETVFFRAGRELFEERRPALLALERPLFLPLPELFPFRLRPAPPADFFFFLATVSLLLPGRRRSSDHTIPKMTNRYADRVVITPLPSGLRVEIHPLVESPPHRRRLLLAAAVLIGAALFGGSRLFSAWDSVVRRGSSEFPFPLLVALTAAVGLSTPLVLLGLSALAFAEETVEVGPREIVIRTSAFERATVRRIARDDLECWRQTLLPLPPWWTWAIERLAASARGRLLPLAGMAGPKEKRRIAAALARATGKPMRRDFGRAGRESGEPGSG